LPEDVRRRLLAIRSDPTEAGPPGFKGRTDTIQVGSPSEDDVFRTYEDKSLGWYGIRTVVIKKGFKGTGSKQTFVVGPNALANPAVAERVRRGFAILVLTSEGNVGVWILMEPDAILAPRSYPYDQAKMECAEAARYAPCRIRYDQERNAHEWRTLDAGRYPDVRWAWPSEPALVLIDRAVYPLTIDRPDHPEFAHLLRRGGW
jgi:hypothetical protein